MAEDAVGKDSDREETHDKAVDENEQPLLTHLVALRNSILKSVIAVAILFVPYFIFSNELYTLVALPLLANLPGDGNMIATEVASPFIVPIKLAAFLSLFTAIPYVLHQIWKFIAPGLYLREKKFAVPLLISSVLLFYLGIVFAYFLVFPLIFQFFAAVTPENVMWMTDINKYLSFIIKLFLAFGIIFEIPIAIVLLVGTGFTTPQKLARKRPYIFVTCFILGMLLTPPDMVSQILLAVPAWLLFEIGVLLSKTMGRGSKES